jgi:hypothetical protein
MSRLAFYGRPWVAFNPQDKEHRKYFAEFQKKGTWGSCPVRFIVPDDGGDLLTLIQRRLIAYYVDKEFVRVENKLSVIDNKSKKRYNNSIAKQ